LTGTTLSTAPGRPGAVRRELARKAFHLASVAVPLFVWLAPAPVSTVVLPALAAVAVGIDLSRLHFRLPRYYFLRYTRTLLRVHERRGLAGATWMAIAYAAALLLLPRPFAVAGMLYNGLADAAAALVGRRFGRHRTAWGKSWEGFAAALLTALGVGLLVPGVPLPGALAGALAAAALEFLPLPVDDNLRVTLGGALFAWLGSLL
jgi:dolichol kinase